MTTMDSLDAMMREAQQVQEHAVEELNQAESFPITGVQLNAASKTVTIYQRQTGEPRVLPKIAAEIALRKRYRDPSNPLFKQFIFAARPTKEYHWGDTKCLLHPDNPRRGVFSQWGLPICESSHLASPGEVRRHMELRHPSANKVIKEDETEQRRREDLEAQRALGTSVLEAMNAMAAKMLPSQTAEAAVGTPEAPLYVSDKPKTVRRRGPNRKK